MRGGDEAWPALVDPDAAAARLVDEQAARGPVPVLEPALEEGVHAAGREPGEVERRGAGAADVAGAGQQSADDLGLSGAPLGVVGEARRDERPVERPRRADGEPALAEEGTLAAHGVERLGVDR